MAYTNLQIFTVELIGTFILVVFATGTIVYDIQIGGPYGLWFAAVGPFIALIIGIYSFGKISMAHFNPAVTIAFYLTGHISRIQILWYFAAEIIGAILGSLFVMNFIGTAANLGANSPNHDYSILLIFPVEILVSALLMGVIFVVVYTKGLKGFGGIAIGGMVGLDIYFFGLISGASMNPARSFAPALLSGSFNDLWIYWSAPFIGTALVSFLFRKKFEQQRAKKP